MSGFDKILDFEAGKLNEQEIIMMFDDLVDSGDIWKLPGHYQESAAVLIERGLIKCNKQKVLN